MTRYRVFSKDDEKVRKAMLKEWPEDPGATIMCNLVGWGEKDGPVMDGDAFVIRDVLNKYGCEWGKDFYINKVEEPT